MLVGGVRRECRLQASLVGRRHSRCLVICSRPLWGVFFRTGVLLPRTACRRRRLTGVLVPTAEGLLFLSPGRLVPLRRRMILVRLFTL